MENTNAAQRIAFSFLPGTFDITRMKPEFWSIDGEDDSAHVQLDARWERLLPALAQIGLVMICAPAGAVTAAVAAPRLRFEPVPDSAEWVCIDTGIELCPANLGGVLAALEPLENGQHTASLQFFDRAGDGCMKLMITNRSDLAAVEDFVRRHATPGHVTPFAATVAAVSPSLEAEPDVATVHALWDGLRRTLPANAFPGMEDVLRRRALAAAGPHHAWHVRETSVLPLIRAMTLADAPLGVGVRNDAVFVPAGIVPGHWADCCCGTTFFSHTSQLTLRHEIHDAEAWVTRFELRRQEDLCLELYDRNGRFRAAIGLRNEAHPLQREQWNHWLREAAC